MEERTTLRRRLNDDRRRRFAASDLLALLCECGDPDCHHTVVLSPSDYDERRPDAIVHPLHAVVPGEGARPDLTA